MAVNLSFGPNADPSRVSALSRDVLTRALAASENPSALVTSVTRTPEDQARIMYDMIRGHGVQYVRGLYKGPGNKVVDTFLRAGTGTLAGTLAAMAATIRMVGPENVSRHCADPARLNVIDLAPSSLLHADAFRAVVAQDPAVSKVLGPPSDPAVHVEIPQPQGVA